MNVTHRCVDRQLNTKKNKAEVTMIAYVTVALETKGKEHQDLIRTTLEDNDYKIKEI